MSDAEMQPFTANELAAMQAAQQAAMQDLCTIGAYSQVTDEYGESIDTWTNGVPQACGLDMRGGREVHDASNTVVITDATVRLPVGTVVDMRDQITITHRFGVPITAIVYEIVSPVRRGASGVLLDLRRVTL